jgi:hypothetical protein
MEGSKCATTNTEIPTMLWHCGFWDIPRSGIALYQGQMVWFELEPNTAEVEYLDAEAEAKLTPEEKKEVETNEKGRRLRYRPPRWGLYELSESQLAAEKKSHEMFQQHVGYNTDHVPGVYRPCTSDREGWDVYYEWAEKQPKTDYSGNRKIAVVSDFKYLRRPR